MRGRSLSLAAHFWPLALSVLTIGVATPSPSTATTEPSASALARIIERRLVRLDRALMTYHYQSSDNPEDATYGPLPFRPANLGEVERRLAIQDAWFYDVDFRNDDMVGPGLYASMDPWGARSYGGESDPLLFAIEVRRGTTVLSTQVAPDPAEFSQLVALYGALQCRQEREDPTFPRRSADLQQWIAAFRNSVTPACRRVLIDTMARRGVDAILYNYTSSNALASCRRNRREAINLIRTRARTGGALGFFSNHASLGPASLASFSRALYAESSPDAYLRTDDSERFAPMPMALSAVAVASPGDYSLWKARAVYKCGPVRPLERMDAYGEIESRLRSEVLSDREVIDAQTQARVAYMQKARTNRSSSVPTVFEFRASRTRVLVEAAYRSEMNARDLVGFDDWVRSVDALLRSDATFQDQASSYARFVGEAPPRGLVLAEDPARLSRAAVDALAASVSNPSAAYAGLRTLGAGPKVARRLIATMREIGWAPTILKTAVFDPRPEIAVRALSENRASFLHRIRECTALYRDPSVSYESIHAGPCGQIVDSTP